MESPILIQHKNAGLNCKIRLSASKSESNRALIIDAVTGFSCALFNVSDARDTETMQRLLEFAEEGEKTLDVIDAGTTMRFLTALMSVKGANVIMTGTPRMQERPIGILVDSLRSLGAQIKYLGKEGYPPLETTGFNYSGNRKLQIKGNVSSQYISALLMVSPLLPNGIEIELLGEIGSRSYIEMTLDLMRHFGVNHRWENQTIIVEKQNYTPGSFHVESDWSGAGYWYGMAALSPKAEIELFGLKSNSLQGDSAVVKICEKLGVQSTFVEEGVILTSGPQTSHSVAIDFTDCPDLAQTIAVICAAKGVTATFTGIESLKIKETDRILALQNELAKIGATLMETSPATYVLTPNPAKIKELTSADKPVHIATYDDHRMAMAFAPLGLLFPLHIEDKNVVKKSYPRFWEHLEKAGFEIKNLQ